MPSNAQLRKYDDAKFKILAASYSYGGQDLEALFRKVDTDGGGDLQFEEFRRACRTYLKIGKQQLPDHELQELFTYIDSLGDGDGNLSIDEILDFIGDKLPQHMIDARERKRLEEERARQAELDAKDADAARQREFEDKRRNANQAVLLKFRVAVKTVRALIRWNNIYMGTRSRGTVFILRSIESGPSVVRELEQVMKQLWFKSVSATSLGSMWETFSQRVKDGKVSNRILFSAVLIPEGRLSGNPPPTADEILSKLEEFATYHGFRAPKLIYYADQDASVTTHENVVAKMRSQSRTTPHSRLPLLPEGVGRVTYPFAGSTFAKLLAGMQSRAIDFSSMWKGGNNGSTPSSKVNSDELTATRRADRARRGLDEDALERARSTAEEQTFIKRLAANVRSTGAQKMSLPLQHKASVNIATASAEELRRHTFGQLGEVEIAKGADEDVTYMNQGDISMYSKENIAKRKAIRDDPEMVKTLALFWDILDHKHDRRGRLRYESYVTMNIKLQKALSPSFDLESAFESAHQDWISDLAAGKDEYDDDGHVVMSRRAFEDSIFEMADLWCISTKLQEYIFFLHAVLDTIARESGVDNDAALVGLRFKPMDQIHSSGFETRHERILKQNEAPSWLKTLHEQQERAAREAAEQTAREEQASRQKALKLVEEAKRRKALKGEEAKRQKALRDAEAKRKKDSAPSKTSQLSHLKAGEAAQKAAGTSKSALSEARSQMQAQRKNDAAGRSGHPTDHAAAGPYDTDKQCNSVKSLAAVSAGQDEGSSSSTSSNNHPSGSGKSNCGVDNRVMPTNNFNKRENQSLSSVEADSSGAAFSRIEHTIQNREDHLLEAERALMGVLKEAKSLTAALDDLLQGSRTGDVQNAIGAAIAIADGKPSPKLDAELLDLTEIKKKTAAAQQLLSRIDDCAQQYVGVLDEMAQTTASSNRPRLNWEDARELLQNIVELGLQVLDGAHTAQSRDRGLSPGHSRRTSSVLRHGDAINSDNRSNTAGSSPGADFESEGNVRGAAKTGVHGCDGGRKGESTQNASKFASDTLGTVGTDVLYGDGALGAHGGDRGTTDLSSQTSAAVERDLSHKSRLGDEQLPQIGRKYGQPGGSMRGLDDQSSNYGQTHVKLDDSDRTRQLGLAQELRTPDTLGRKNNARYGDLSPWNTSTGDKSRVSAAALIKASKEEYRPQTQQHVGTRYVNLKERADRLRSNFQSDQSNKGRSRSPRGMGRSSHVFAIVRGARSEAERFLAMGKEQKTFGVVSYKNGADRELLFAKGEDPDEEVPVAKQCQWHVRKFNRITSRRLRPISVANVSNPSRRSRNTFSSKKRTISPISVGYEESATIMPLIPSPIAESSFCSEHVNVLPMMMPAKTAAAAAKAAGNNLQLPRVVSSQTNSGLSRRPVAEFERRRHRHRSRSRQHQQIDPEPAKSSHHRSTLSRTL